jgi:F-type H+-transporting ATPase subunit b
MTASFMTINATFVIELVVFIVVLAVLARFVIRPLQAAMQRRQAEIDKAQAQARHTEELLAAAQTEYDATLAQARREARQIIEASREIGTFLEHEGRQRAQQHLDRSQCPTNVDDHLSLAP